MFRNSFAKKNRGVKGYTFQGHVILMNIPIKILSFLFACTNVYLKHLPVWNLDLLASIQYKEFHFLISSLCENANRPICHFNFIVYALESIIISVKNDG